MKPLPLVIAALAAAGLTGCAVEIVPVGHSSNPSTTTPATVFAQETNTAPTTIGVASGPSGSGTVVQGPLDDTDIPDDAFRSGYEGRFDLTTGCPGGTVVIDQASQWVKITQSCHSVYVRAASVVVVAQDVDNLVIESNSSLTTALVANLGTASIAASSCTLYWDSGNPAVKVTGYQNTAQPNPAKGR
jgi:hypothetical protein